jgi:ribosomal protein S18 acetylase RimI-like enzyme
MPEIQIHTVKPEHFENLSMFEHGYYTEYVWQMALELQPETSQVEFRRVRLPRRVFVAYPRERQQIFEDISSVEAFLVGFYGEQPVGYIKLQSEIDTKIARVSDLVISASQRRQGIASGLILAVLDLVSHRHFHTLLLEMQSKNDPAIQMAHKLGFNFCGFRDHYFPNQELSLFYSRFVR